MRDSDFDKLADGLGDVPGHTIPLHALRTRRCEVWLAGSPAAPDALAMVVDYIADEPYAFGHDASKAVAMLRAIPQWKCVNVATEFADAMAGAMQTATGRKVVRHADIYFKQTRPLRIPAHPAVRFLDPSDAALIATAPDDVRPGDSQFVKHLLTEGFCTAAIIDGQLVAQTHAYCITGKHAELGAKTASGYGRRGLSTACAGMLCARLCEEGKIPVWSTFETNLASQRVAEKLGFSRVAERAYLRLE